MKDETESYGNNQTNNLQGYVVEAVPCQKSNSENVHYHEYDETESYGNSQTNNLQGYVVEAVPCQKSNSENEHYHEYDETESNVRHR